ncbi:hypothetical protein C463_07237 [Halorubrum californiense DSM 19288]|uniref:DUF7969 domain-containing protein n=1 Tax=Halorubrum californiense DSM 19288 TaxID=1227465 RepID=M0EAE0_9EURY|nr:MULTISPECIES: hypothetical protein [Halorubrum]ELZ44730.1 hypothetical protein C463_07237 [Halorubrum californiense DSM 19288]TKX71688.1 hypothetical protein EXE40_07760 [Halorubrum sp. GN11GM_10-3_MGM]
MSYPVTYYCPHCGTLVALEREGYLADKSVTPYPLEGWTYVAPTEPFDAEEAKGGEREDGDGEGDEGGGGESDGDAVDADGVRFVCGESDGVEWDPHDGVRGTDVGGDEPYREPDAEGVGCGEPFYLSFVRFEAGREIDPAAAAEPVEINPDPRPSGPRGPGGPGEAGGPSDSDGGFW